MSKLKRDRLKKRNQNGELFKRSGGASISLKKPSAQSPSLRVYKVNKELDREKVFKKLNIIDINSSYLDRPTIPIECCVNRIICGDAKIALSKIPDESIRCIITSPPYWNVVDYGVEEQYGQGEYQEYLDQLLGVWRECERILKPNGKLCINVPIMPISKAVIGSYHTRHIKNLSSDIEHSILMNISEFQRFSLYIWQKQTTEKMFGSYPYPPNAYEQNTIEFINILVKKGKPDRLSKAIKQASIISSKEWMNLTKQVWKLYPADVKRTKHPAPFPVALANRLIAMYTFARVNSGNISFDGDIVLDPFVGTGATCIAALELGRRYIGVDLVPDFCIEAVKRLEQHKFTGKIDTNEYGNNNSKAETASKRNQLELET